MSSAGANRPADPSRESRQRSASRVRQRRRSSSHSSALSRCPSSKTSSASTHTRSEAQPDDPHSSGSDNRRSVGGSSVGGSRDIRNRRSPRHVARRSRTNRLGRIQTWKWVDLQLERSGVVELYAIQSAPNTKSAGGRRSDVDALRRAAGAIRASKRRVDLYIAVLSGQRASRALGSDPNILVLASDEFWERVSGIADFRPRLIRTTASLSGLVMARAASEVARIRADARETFGDAEGNLDLAKLADPPPRPRKASRVREA